MCGEKHHRQPPQTFPAGSPPRVRGKDSLPAARPCPDRITPACAGKRLVNADEVGAFKDHPRVCGEKWLVSSGGQRQEGSPPRVRGKALLIFQGEFNVGITPACAGKRGDFLFLPPKTRDHPRVCGEKSWFSVPMQRPIGSPPRVRGKVRFRGKGILRQWITPACAGKRGSE